MPTHTTKSENTYSTCSISIPSRDETTIIGDYSISLDQIGL